MCLINYVISEQYVLLCSKHSISERCVCLLYTELYFLSIITMSDTGGVGNDRVGIVLMMVVVVLVVVVVSAAVMVGIVC